MRALRPGASGQAIRAPLQQHQWSGALREVQCTVGSRLPTCLHRAGAAAAAAATAAGGCPPQPAAGHGRSMLHQPTNAALAGRMAATALPAQSGCCPPGALGVRPRHCLCPPHERGAQGLRCSGGFCLAAALEQLGVQETMHAASATVGSKVCHVTVRRTAAKVRLLQAPMRHAYSVPHE